MKKKHLQILRDLLSLPTAPCCEEAVIDYIRSFADEHSLDFRQDPAGNVVLRYRKGPSRRNRWVFSAHMDHPGFVALKRRGRTLWAQFRGWVAREFFSGSSVRFFTPDGEVTAEVQSISKSDQSPWRKVRLKLDSNADVPPGAIGMWNFPGVRVRGSLVSARGCDDVAGVASALCALEQLASRKADADVTALLTRCEEGGFVGALAACKAGTIPRGARVVAIETSQAQRWAPLGGGMVIRVGDKMRTFDSSLTSFMVAVARGLKKRGNGFSYRREMMPGGTCESTVYSVWGYKTAAVCVPLGNYHNQGRGGKIAPEQINLDDYSSLVSLLAGLGESQMSPDDVDTAMRAELEQLFAARGPYLENPVFGSQ